MHTTGRDEQWAGVNWVKIKQLLCIIHFKLITTENMQVGSLPVAVIKAMPAARR